MSAPLRRTLSQGVRAAFRAPAASAASTWAPAGVVAPLAARTAALGGFRGFASDSDDDFKPKVHASGGDEVHAAIASDVKENRVVVYMKGTKDAPQCGFSNMVVQILNHQGVEYKALNVLASDELRAGIKDFTSWPTIPQIFIDGEFVGGCDIMKQMHTSGELNKVFAEKK